jgi:ATP/maltotriose-dependent transcriptional regulator MalT
VRPHGWYRGSTASADVAALSAGLARSAATVVPGAGRRMLERLGIAGAPPATAGTLANMLGEDLAVWPQDAWLAIDDYHFAMESEASETFVEELLARCPVRLLITSRGRPTWATPRRMLYGEILEVGRSVLALTHDEARQVLPERKVEEVAGVHALTEGWPAVIGLASLSNDLVLSEAELPDALYSYCAEELFHRFAPEVQQALCTLALSPSISFELVRALYGEAAMRIVESGEAGGFLTRAESGEFDMHPLLRTVLLRKLEEQGSDRADRAMHELAGHLIRAKRWDEAFAVAHRAADPALREEVIDGALDAMLTEARLETLKHWLARARTDAPSALLDLAEAEVAFREADLEQALFQAVNSASQLANGDPRASRAWFRAGQSAYFLNRTEEARDSCTRALEAAANPRDAKDALWGLFNARLDLEDKTTSSILTEIERLRPLTLVDEARLRGGKIYYATRWGDLDDALRAAQPFLERLGRLDPMSQTGFLNNYAHGLALSARYEDALEPLDLELTLARDFSLGFVLPYALLLKAWALMGLRQFDASRKCLESVPAWRDPFISTAVSGYEARLHLFHGRAAEALNALKPQWIEAANPSHAAELTAIRALALAVLRRLDEAEAACDEAVKNSQTIEAETLVCSVRAVISLKKPDPSAADLAVQAFETAIRHGSFDGFVCAYRACPELLGLAARHAKMGPTLSALTERAHDGRLARRFGLEAPAGWQLTAREREVLDLLVEGLTNREIASRLFLAEVTVKVHVRHILRKLGVRSRTEAAVRATMSKN